MFKDATLEVLYNPDLITENQALGFGNKLKKKLEDHDELGKIIGKKIGTVSAHAGTALAETTVATVQLSRKKACKGATAQYIADFLGEDVNEFLAELTELHVRIEVFLGTQQGIWKRT